jgi:orotidine-5'-phosphate decarboxylase
MWAFLHQEETTAMTFIEKLRERWQRADSLLCVGLDPDPAKFPDAFVDDGDLDDSEALFAFCRDIADATAQFACAFKPQIAYFAAHNGGEAALQRLIAHINATHPDVPVILDAKRGDIGSTAEQYAVEAFDRFGADAVTLNPYMGRDSAAPFLQRNDRGCVFLCHTSNPGARDFQELVVSDEGGDGEPLYQRIARMIAREWNADGNCALVVGATFPEELKVIRGIVGDMPLLIPGIGAQGGDVEATVRSGRTAEGTGLMINSSRGILYASSSAGYAEAAANAARALRDEINRYR